MVKCQIKGSNDNEILSLSFDKKQKADEVRNPMKLKSNDLDLRSERNPCLKINKNPSLKLGKKMNLNISKL